MGEAARSLAMEEEAPGLRAFLAGIAAPDAAGVFHAVRRLPYHSSGDRSLAGILARRAGSCSSKHILLAALLGEIGIEAQVELVLGDFAAPFRTARAIPSSLMVAAMNGVRDIHNIVRARIGGEPVILDATWHDAMKPFGLRVNDGWAGVGGTEVAVDVAEFLGPASDPASAKAEIIGSWPKAEQARRRDFLENVNSWVAGLPGA